MTARRTTIALGVIALGLAGVVAVQAVRSSGFRAKAERLDRHCGLVRVAMRMDGDWFSDPHSPERRVQAVRRFGVDAGHSHEEIVLCVGHSRDLSLVGPCKQNSDYACLAAMARRVEAAIE